MTDDLVERLLDWPYQGETMAHEAADSIKQLVATNKQLTAERDHAWAMVEKADTQMGQSLADHLQAKAERDRLRYERDAILLDGTVHSDQREKYERLCARIAAGKASQQDAVEAIRQLCRDNERLALRRSDARAEAAEAERDRLREALSFYADFHEAPSDGPWGVESQDFGEVARAALKGESHD